MNLETEPLSLAAQEFIDSVLALKPRIAVFDCDGTLWSGDSGADFFYWQLDRRMFPESVAKWAIDRYADYKRGNVDETTMCGEMVTINNGIPETRSSGRGRRILFLRRGRAHLPRDASAYAGPARRRLRTLGRFLHQCLGCS